MKNMIKQALLVEVLAPLSRRLGTFIGTALTSWGVSAENVDQIEACVPLLVGAAVDVVLSNVNRRNIIRKVLK